ncbi:hypothetical protein Cgig2_006162 [Carnegiea gigantea]|uniref:RING-type domain-containing protein n=1 Tax=Carnegiea gigantea TaxID=171969 RepID=A0A9Q1L1F9_9CARY|nr:hypothetical protein Cgig2_006162 [Carnegiea gigantea]
MDAFHCLPRDHSYIESLDIQEQVIPTRNPNRHSSSSSSQPVQLEFLVNFTIHDSARLPFPYIDPLPLLSQRLTTSNTLSIDPEVLSSSCWFWARLELNRIGLQTRFIEPVVNVLQAKVYAIISSFPTHRQEYGQASVMLQVNIKRLTMVPIHHVPWLTNMEKKVKEVPMKLPCKHVFHEGCIHGWFRKSHFCPLCRSNVLAAS